MTSVATSGERTSAAKLPAADQPETTIAFAKTADAEEQSYLLLHLVRVLALYLYVYLSQNPLLADDLLLQRGVENVGKLELELHTLLLACVEAEVASNQFDGLVQEKNAFLAIKKLFRLERTKAATQCRALVALLSAYLSLMTAPIVTCAPFSMVASTLEYLAKENKKDVSLSLLYPIVNAIDSLSIEQRECLDALTRLWKWVATCGPSELLLTQLASRHHAAIIQVDAAEPVDEQRSVSSSATDLGACFVTTLLRYSDHIFRHDPEDLDLQTSLESDTEEDESAEDMSEPEQQTPASASTVLTKTPTLPLLTATEVEVTVPVATSSKSSPSSAKSLSKSMRRRKKKADEKLAKKPVKKEDALVEDDADSQSNPAEDESLATVVCVGIAAAAGTIAAALCVIFT